MQDNDSFASQVNKSQMTQEKTAESSLITLERSQKLDLLIHLISNLRQSLIICGPKGIGKTTLLDELKTRKQEQWAIYFIKASSNLSFESFQDQLLQFLKQNYDEYKNQDILSILSSLDKQNQKIVVIIDDSGQLVPGLISTIIQYASSHACLRMVFSLTHDELHIKNSSDQTVDECHFIDLPPLTEKQCSIFLQNLSAKPDAIVSFGAVNDRLIEKLYQKTHGIPGRIVSELPALSNYTAVAEYRWSGAVLIAAAVALGIGYIIYDEPNPIASQDKITTSVLLPKPEVVEISSPVVQLITKEEVEKGEEFYLASDPLVLYTNQLGRKSSTESALRQKDSEKNSLLIKKLKEPVAIQISRLENRAIDNLINNKLAISGPRLVPEKAKVSPILDTQIIKSEEKKENTTKTNVISETLTSPKHNQQNLKTGNKKPTKVEIKKKTTNKRITTKLKTFTENNDSQWILKQPKINYTIQLMVLSKHKSVIDFMNKNQNLKESLKYFQIGKKNPKKYAIIYGSYKSIAAASKQMKSLPVQYRKSWVRSYKILQKEM